MVSIEVSVPVTLQGERLSEQSGRLPNAPLVLAALEVKYPELTPTQAHTARPAVRDAVRGALPLTENINENIFAIGPDGPMPTQTRTFPRFTTRDRTTALAITSQAAVLETTDYDGFSAFHSLIRLVMKAIEDAVQPDGIVRIGMRYIDEIRVPTVTELPGDWSGYIDHHLLAAVSPDFLAKTELQPKAWQGLVQYATGPDQVLQVRYGPQEGYAVDPKGPTRRKNPSRPGPFFLLDSDSWWEPSDEVPAFTAAMVSDVCTRLHPPLRHIFAVVSQERLMSVYRSSD